MTGSSGSSGGQGGGNKVGNLLLAGGLALLLGVGVTVTIVTNLVPKPPVATPEPPPPASASTAIPPRTTGGNAPPPIRLDDKEELRGRDRDAVVLTVTAYGMPARIGIQATNDAEVLSRGNYAADRGVDAACLPDVQYPGACVSFIVTKRGATVTVTAGDARAGFWPILEYVRGAGCDIADGSKDESCTLSLAGDVDMTALYSGDYSGGKVQYPTCPVPRPPARNDWESRCR